MFLIVETLPEKRSALRRVLTVTAVLLLILAVGVAIGTPLFERYLERRAAETLRNHFQSKIDFASLKVSLFPRAGITGERIILHRDEGADQPPFIAIAKFTAKTNVVEMLRRPAHISQVRLEGLRIHIFRRGGKKPDGNRRKEMPDFSINEVVADGTVLVIHPKKAGKDPQVYDIKKLTLTDAGPNLPMDFRAVLINAKPPGEIQSTGKFGPWNREDVGETPVSGKYTFDNADLSVFKGIAGILASRGEYQGVLGRIEVDGDTDTPDFMLKKAMNPVPLVTHFHAIVDGTDGDTYLQPVRAQFGHSVVVARGQVAKEPGAKGKTIALDATVQNGRLEDMLLLGVRSKKPALYGDISFRTKIVIPPGDVDVVDKLHLDGRFTVAKARASRPSVQQKIDLLSHRGRGITKDDGADTVASDFKGRFVLNSGLMTFRDLSFRVPGVSLTLNGTFNLENQEMDFRGTARMDARLSQMTTGFKSLLLKAVDPFFAKEGSGTVLPIAITGTKDSPSFRLSRNAPHPGTAKENR